jgi:hypothetical protein
MNFKIQGITRNLKKPDYWVLMKSDERQKYLALNKKIYFRYYEKNYGKVDIDKKSKNYKQTGKI